MNNKGYTLIEILVAMSIFTIVVASPTGFLISFLKQQQRALAMQELTDNISYNLEYMSKALRMATKDNEDGNCLPSDHLNYEITINGNGIKFNDYNQDCKEFYLEDGKLYEIILPGDPVALTPDSIIVTSFKVKGMGLEEPAVGANRIQPRVTIFLEAKGEVISDPDLEPIIKTQTTISQRNLNFNF